MIKKILVANRGEIAIRVMRSAREMGIATVAVYSAVDRNAMHVRFADEAVFIGPAPSKESYLVIPRIIEAALQSGADAIHPGYGFLSENAAFALAVEKAGLIFIGPPAEAIDMMGNKLSAKEAAKKFDIPMIPGTDGAVTDVAQAQSLCEKIGYPVLIKAAAGGGGKGMRVVHNAAEFKEQMERAQSEALSAFGDPAVFIEKFVTSPKHIEIQVLADTHGKILYLFERECSVQRRHQKVVEEAPSCVLTPDIRRAMGEAAVRVARSCNYVGAGTVEFLLDENKQFYFLEMNTRLQVEHPVTELITGIDLVKEQIKVAQGEALSFSQDDLQIKGHALELRVYAENPFNNFLPDTGRLLEYRKPEGPGIRVDDGYEEGMDIPIYYDPMIAKLIAYGKDREEAIQRLLRAIAEYKISGVHNTLELGKFIIQHPVFQSGAFDTHFLDNYFSPEVLQHTPDEVQEVGAIFASFLLNKQQTTSTEAPGQTKSSVRSDWQRNRS